ncbi:NAD-dependent epimerase/dehydratase family protein [Yinghuangia seranimata]|uniref:NAD-dependent epimerase/dehydratase family protein n=1 Tax=Yinghuangia seranimata TaxID=408067 RepID=UPI00248CB561|nr:NAD-dependent epimerase/dehydratase family protein [Yinghuangia seranimata]MDI2127531.1 NAD-dependent epimerase/dehydratase family protein [Yinghuangia seranimata]
MALHIVTGAGSTGIATARLLADRGERVRVVTRRGTGPEHPLVERVAADVTDPDTLAGLLDGARTLYNCAAPPYDQWRTAFPPLAASLLAAAERTGTDYVMLGNAYGYGLPHGPFTPGLPMAPVSDKGRVRAAMWEDALAAHEAGRVRVAEVRASDFLAADAISLFCLMVAPAARTGGAAVYPGGLDAPQSWSYTGDVARTLVAVGDAHDRDEVWGRAWHVPSSVSTVRDLAARVAKAAGAAQPELTRMTADQLAAAAAADSIMGEVAEMEYLYDDAFLLDASETERVLGVAATDFDAVVREVAGAAAGE